VKGIEVWQKLSNLIFCFSVHFDLCIHFQKACPRLLLFGFNKVCFLWGGVVNPVPNPKPGGLGCPFCLGYHL
jgi:hypothetical protein